MQLYKVPDMTCGHCVQTIEKAVKALDPSAEVICNLKTREVSVEARALPREVAEALAAVGYDAALIEA